MCVKVYKIKSAIEGIIEVIRRREEDIAFFKAFKVIFLCSIKFEYSIRYTLTTSDIRYFF